MKITSVILALSAVVALTQAQLNSVNTGETLNTVNGAVGTVHGTAGQVIDAVRTSTLRRRQNAGQIVDSVKNVAEQRLSGLPLRKRGSIEDITGATGSTLPSDLGLTAEGVLEKIKPITAVLEGALVSGVKKAIVAEAGHAVHLSVEIAAQLRVIVSAAVDAEITSLVAQISAVVGVDIMATVHSAFEHLCAVLIPDVNVLLQSYPLTKGITLTAPDLADLTVDKVTAKVLSIAGELPSKVEETVGQVEPKVQETLGQVKPKVDETLEQVKPKVEETVEQVKSKVDETVGQVKPKVDETVGQVKPKVDETVGQLKPKVDETVGQLKPKIDETVEKVKSTVPVQVPAVSAA